MGVKKINGLMKAMVQNIDLRCKLEKVHKPLQQEDDNHHASGKQYRAIGYRPTEPSSQCVEPCQLCFHTRRYTTTNVVASKQADVLRDGPQ